MKITVMTNSTEMSTCIIIQDGDRLIEIEPNKEELNELYAKLGAAIKQNMD